MGRRMEWVCVMVLAMVAITSADLAALCAAPTGPRVQELCDFIILASLDSGELEFLRHLSLFLHMSLLLLCSGKAGLLRTDI